MSKLFLQEQIIHKTNARPFSLHHTVVAKEEESVLYLHCHEEMELFYVIEGSILFSIEESTFILHAKEAIFIPPNLLHHAKREHSTSSPCSFYAIVFSPEMIFDLASSNLELFFSPIRYQPKNYILLLKNDVAWNKQILIHISAIFSTISFPIEQIELSIRGNLLIVWQAMYNEVFSKCFDLFHSNISYTQIKLSIDYMINHYDETISLHDLSNIATMSEGYYCRTFKSYIGETPFEYLNHYRITKSCEQLLHTKKKVAEIATLNGFNTISYFNRVFLELTATTPSEYRKHFIKH